MYSTIYEQMQALAKSCPNQLAIVEPDRQTTYSQLFAQSDRLAAHFKKNGMQAGDRLALWLPNGIEWVQCFLACAQIGVTVLSVNTRFKSHEVQDVIERGQARWLIFWPDFKGIAFDQILADVPASVMARLKGQLTLNDIRHCLSTPIDAVAPHGDHGVLTFTTSGTTSLPKFVLHTQAGLLRHGHAIARALDYDQTCCILASAPFCGAFGFATLAGGLFNGYTVACEAVSDPDSLRALIRSHRVTHTYANNALILQILQTAGDHHDFESCRLFGFASFAPAQDALFDQAKRHGIKLTGLYGSSELQALQAAQPTDPADGDITVMHQPGGRLLHEDARVRARDPETGHLLALGQSGEIEILTPSRMAAYMDQPEATHDAFTDDGYYRTGDLGWCVSERQFVFQARMGDSLRLGGFLVNPAEIEQVVQTLPGITACQVVAAQWHQKIVPVAFVLTTGQTVGMPDQWQAECKRRLAGFKIPVHFEVLDEFPTVLSANSVKIQKHKLREMAQALLDTKP